MSKKVIVRAWAGIKEEITINDNDSYTDFVNKFYQIINLDFDKSVRFIYKGKIIKSDNFNIIENGGTCLCMLTHKNTNNAINNEINDASTSILNDDVNNNVANDNMVNNDVKEENIKEEDITKYNYKQVKASLIVFLDFIRNNPQLKNLYMNDYAQLVNELINNQDVNNIVKNILNQSDQIIKAMETGTNIQININGDTGKVDEIVLTKDDEATITEIIQMGFDSTIVVKTYIELNYNKEKTINKLLGI